ncbi:DUF5811 family protein [Halobacteriales archaeon Cl-PHB]
MYGNTPFADEDAPLELSTAERRHLRRDLASVAARTRELLPSEFVVGSEIADGQNGPRATVAVQPPIGGIVSADYTPAESSLRIEEDERDDIATGLAASAALQVKQAYPDDQPPVAK